MTEQTPIYEDLRSIEFLREIAFLPKTPLLTNVCGGIHESRAKNNKGISIYFLKADSGNRRHFGDIYKDTIQTHFYLSS